MMSLFGANGHLAPVTWAFRAQSLALANFLGAVHSSESTRVEQNPHLVEPWAQDIVNTPSVVNHVIGLIGTDAAVDQSFLVIKWPGADFAVPMHQDGVSVDFELDPLRSVSCWLSISDAPEAAGALQVSPGSHHWGYVPHAFETTGALAAHDDERLRTCEFTALPTTAGEALLFDTRLLHRSAPNTTENPRIGLNIVYSRPDAYLRGSASARAGWMPLRLP